MKLRILFMVSLGLTTFVHSQSIKSTYPGYAYDSFNSSTEYVESDGLGIFLSSDTVNFAVPYFKTNRIDRIPKAYSDGVFKSFKQRTGNGVISYLVSQPYGMYNITPQLNVNFGNGKSLDLKDNDALKLTIGLKIDLESLINTIEGVSIFFALKDAFGTLINSKGLRGGTTLQWQDEIYVNIDKKGHFKIPESLEKNVIFIDSITNEHITYITIFFNDNKNQTAYEAVYPKLTEYEYVVNEKCVGNLKGDNDILGASRPILGFDKSKVAGFQLTFSQSDKNEYDCYHHQELTDLKFDFTGFILGNSPVSASDLDAGPLEIKNEFESSSNKLVAYPNPIKDGFLNLSQNAENVKVYDAIGNIVFSANSTSKLNVDGFAKGLYVLKSSKGFTRFVVE